MRTVVAAFEKSDLRPLLDAIHDDIVWKTASSQDGLFRFSGEYRSRDGIKIVLATLAKVYTFYRMKPKEIISSGDVVWGVFDAGLLFDPKGENEPKRNISLEMAIRWKLKDGKIVEHQAFFDTASLLAQQRRSARSASRP